MKRVPRGALMLSAITTLNVLLGFAREAVVAYYFGASAELDGFLVAYTLPRIIIFQAVNITVSVVLPLYVAHLEGGRPEDATNLLRRWTIFLAKASTVFCLIVAILANVIIALIGPGLSDAQTAEAANWLRWLLPMIWLITMSGVCKVVLDHNRRFFLSALSNTLISGGAIAGAVIGAGTLGVAAMIPGLLIGALLGFVLQAIQSGRFEPRLFSLRDLPLSVRLPLISGGIVMMNAFAQQANLIVDRAFASQLAEGSIAALNYANSLTSIPQTIISSAVATALFPVLSQLIARGQWRKAFGTTLRWAGLTAVLGVIVVAAVAVWGHSMVALVFQRGKFTAEATAMTASALYVLSFALIAQCCNPIVVRLMLAQQQLRALLSTTIIAIAVKVVANFLLVDRYGLEGVAAATAISAGAATGLRIWIVWRYRPGTPAPAG
jgi:putative peptidoglycan lipid II flippase